MMTSVGVIVNPMVVMIDFSISSFLTLALHVP
jgi:hypothetical protein